MLFTRYSIATRIGCVVGVIIIMMLVLAIVEMRGLDSIRGSLDDIVGKHYQRLQIAQDMRFLARHGAVVVRNVLLVDDVDEKAYERKRLEECAAEYGVLLEKLKQQEQTAEEKKIIEAVVRGGDVTFQRWRTIVRMDDGGSSRQAMQMLQDEVRKDQWGLLDNLEALVGMEKKLAELTMAAALENYARAKSVMAMVNILAIGAGLFSVAVVTGSIVAPLNEISRKVDRIADGDFTTRIELDQQDEIGQLAAHINRMVEKLNASEAELEEYRYHLEELIELRTGEVNEQRERFISVLIHDLKGPLVPIIGFSRLLLAKDNLPADKVSRYSREIFESTTKLAMAIDQTSQSLRQKRMALSFDQEPFDVKELLCAVTRDCQPALKAESITLKVNNQEVEEYRSSPEVVMFSGDICKLRTLLENLIGNAGKYARSRIDIYLSLNSEQIDLVVDDDGRGVAEPFRRKIFEEYYQAPGSKNGTGIGLYSVKKIVDHYRGTIAVQTSPLGGARFVVSLPVTGFHPNTAFPS